MATKATAVETKISLQFAVIINGQECSVIIEAPSASAVHAELNGLLSDDAPQAEATPTPKPTASPAPAAAAPAPTETAPPTPAPTATAPAAAATPSATTTAAPSTEAEVSVAELLGKAKELLALPNGEATLGEVLKAHGFGRVSTVPAESRGAVFADLTDAVQGL